MKGVFKSSGPITAKGYAVGLALGVALIALLGGGLLGVPLAVAAGLGFYAGRHG